MVFWTDYFELPQDDIDYIRETYKQEKFIRYGSKDYKHYTGYYHSLGASKRSNNDIKPGSFVDTRLQKIYTPVLKNIIRKMGLFDCDDPKNMFLSYNQLWVQLYTKEFSDKSKMGCTLHAHYAGIQSLFSWVHFVDVPEEKCFYWQGKTDDGGWGEKHYPEVQSTGHLVLFPSWCWHGVDRVISQDDRVVVAGNILRLR